MIMEDYSSKMFKDVQSAWFEKGLSDESKIKKEKNGGECRDSCLQKMLRISSLKYDIYTTYAGLKQSEEGEENGRCKYKGKVFKNGIVKQHTAMGNINLRKLCLQALDLHKIGQVNNQLWVRKGWCSLLLTDKIIDS